MLYHDNFNVPDLVAFWAHVLKTVFCTRCHQGFLRGTLWPSTHCIQPISGEQSVF